MWILILIVVLIILSVMFGGFTKGTKTSGLGAPPLVAAAGPFGRPADGAIVLG
jgi:hypothetical protein